MTPKKNRIFLSRSKEPVVPKEPVEPEEPAEPEDPKEPVEPAEPEDPKEPVEPVEPEDPDEPVEPRSDESFDTMWLMSLKEVSCVLEVDVVEVGGWSLKLVGGGSQLLLSGSQRSGSQTPFLVVEPVA